MTGEAILFILLGVAGAAVLLATRRRGPRLVRWGAGALAVIGASFAIAQLVGPPVLVGAVTVVCARPDVTYC